MLYNYEKWETQLKKFVEDNQEICFDSKYCNFMEYLDIVLTDNELTNYTFIKMLYAFMFGLMMKESIFQES